MITAPAPSAALPLLDHDPAPAPELVVLSGKGGTGKTSILASFAVLAGSSVVADCDVDAADLHLVLRPDIIERHRFISGHEAAIRDEDCTACGACADACRFGAAHQSPTTGGFTIDPIACEGCGVCVRLCPARAISFNDRCCGEWFLSRIHCGQMVHARLGIAAESSGRLVTLLRNRARQIATEQGRPAILVDGPPGIGCPVIASMTGATAALIVTEPTVSGAHDLERVLDLSLQLETRSVVCVNRWDLNPEGTRRIERLARSRGAVLAGRIRFDPAITRAQVEARTVVELGGPAAQDICALWEIVRRLILENETAHPLDQ